MSPLAASVLFMVLGLLFVLLGMPLAMGKVPPNSLYGFRTPRTLANPETWYAVNRVAGRDLVWVGSIASLAALTIAVLAHAGLHLTGGEAVVIEAAVLVIGLAAAVVHGLVSMPRL